MIKKPDLVFRRGLRKTARALYRATDSLVARKHLKRAGVVHAEKLFSYTSKCELEALLNLALACPQGANARQPSGEDSGWKRVSSSDLQQLMLETISVHTNGEQPYIGLKVVLTLSSLKKHKPAFVAIDIADPFGTVIMQAIPTIAGFIGDQSPNHKVYIDIDLPP